jgi:hypothetical protein
MGILETIDGMNLSDEEKDKLRQEYAEEQRPLRVAGFRNDADEFVAKLSDAGLASAPGVLKRVRRILMSEDAHEPAAILMSDADLQLSGEDATGATSREEVTLADEVKALFSLFPGFAEGKLKIALSEQGGVASGAGTRPDEGDESPEKRTTAARENIRRVTGTGGEAAPMTRKRYRRGGHAAVAGGDN